jgi:NAD(P)-dependent dehydrogenase (short-subunit alcohol dehydrogenase family)
MSAVIVGGARGLGREIARTLLEAGLPVSVIARHKPAEREALVQEALKSGPIRYLVFCQRYRGEGDAWQGELDTTLTLTRSMIETFEPHFAPSGDRAIVMTGSVLAEHVGNDQPAGYHAAKAGLVQLMRFYAASLGPKGIRVNAVSPATFLKEESRQHYLRNQPLMALYRDMVPLGRIGTAADVANVVAFLCSDKAAFVSGQNIGVDGGLSVLWPEQLAQRLMGLR